LTFSVSACNYLLKDVDNQAFARDQHTLSSKDTHIIINRQPFFTLTPPFGGTFAILIVYPYLCTPL